MPERILVTGATGYIGGRLVPRLLQAGYPVRCFVRDPGRLNGHAWSDQVEIVAGDALEIPSLEKAMQGISTAFYLIHGMRGDRADAGRDLRWANRGDRRETNEGEGDHGRSSDQGFLAV